MASEVLVADEGEVRVLTLDRPACLNALDRGTRRALAGQLAEAGKDENIRALVITGTGEWAFCAGQDLNESAALAPADGPGWMASWTAYFDALSTFPKPLVAAVNGVAAGAGFQTALLADLRLATPEARFIMAEVDAGLPAIVGEFLLRAHLGRSRAVELVLTGRALDAAEARDAGLLSELANVENLRGRALALAEALAAKPAQALRLDIGRFRAQLGAGLAEAEAAAARYQAEAVATGEPQKVMAAFLDRRAS
jgi:enoyl-CoA hydratase/carnithine racemase